MTQEEAIYILEKVIPNSGGTIRKDKLEELIRFSNDLTGQSLGLPGCSCEWQAMWHRCYSVLNQYNSQINALAYPPQPKTRTKKSNA